MAREQISNSSSCNTKKSTPSKPTEKASDDHCLYILGHCAGNEPYEEK